MPKLTDTQLVILSTAAQRDDGAALPLPKSLKLQGGAVNHVLKSLLKKGLLDEQPAGNDAAAWRETKDGQRLTLVITDAGRRRSASRQTSRASRHRQASRRGLEAIRRPPPQGERVERRDRAKSKAKRTASPAALRPGHQAGPAGRSPAAQGGRHHRRGREGDGLAAALGARRDQRRAQEEARSGRHLRQGGGSRPGLSDRSEALTPLRRTPGRSPWPTTTVPSAPICCGRCAPSNRCSAVAAERSKSARGGSRRRRTCGDQSVRRRRR